MKRPKEVPGAGVSPELRSFIDNVIVPALVREWLAEHRPKKSLAEAEPEGVESAPNRGRHNGRGRGGE